jgi:hypothetical protein
MNCLRQKLLFVAAVLSLCICISAQDLPNKIRGYKVHNEIIKLTNAGSKTIDKPYVTVGTPTVSDVSLSGVTLAIIGELEEAGYNGRVEMMMFRDFRVNGIAVDVAEYNTPFDVKKTGKTSLPAPATVFLPTTRILNAAWKEITESKNDWTVTGRVFVFGKFKKFGFSFKRVIPVDVNLTIKNPLLEFRREVTSGNH